MAAIVSALLSLAPALVVTVQVVAALFPRRLQFDDEVDRAIRTTVVIPAHNEAGSVAKTVRSVRHATGTHTQILVVADNCDDETAEYAREEGATVVERHDLTRRGKAYALGHAIESLRQSPPDVIVVMDADSAVGGRSMDRLAAVAHRLQRPVQSLNLIDRRRQNERHAVVQTLGNRFHNLVRPLGNAKLGWPCLLMGSGMAFPWSLAAEVGLQNDSLGEDKQLGIDMTIASVPPMFYPYTKVASYVPGQYHAYLGQRTRWEHGHLLAMVDNLPRLIWAAVRQRRLSPLLVALDLAVPPMAMQVAVWLLAAGLALTCGIAQGQWLPGVIVLFVAALQTLAFLVTWLMFSRRRVPYRDVLAIPGYILGKLPIYARLITRGPQRVWLRCERHEDATIDPCAANGPIATDETR